MDTYLAVLLRNYVEVTAATLHIYMDDTFDGYGMPEHTGTPATCKQESCIAAQALLVALNRIRKGLEPNGDEKPHSPY